MRGTLNVGRMIANTARLYPDRPGLVHGNRSWTWRHLNERTNSMVATLRNLGVGKGDRIVVVSRNNQQMFESMWAAFKVGAVWVACNFRLAAPELAYIAGNCRAKVMIYDEGFESHADAAKSSTPSLKLVIAIAKPRDGEVSYENLIAQNKGASDWEEEVAADDPAWHFYTSGTTGRSKGAVLTHGVLGFMTTNMIADLMPGLSPEDVALVVAPLSHGAGAHTLPQVARGAKSVLLDSRTFDVEECWRLIQEHRVSNMFTVPTIVKMLVEHPSVEKYDHSSLRHVVYAGAPMYREDQKTALIKLGNVFVQYYGMGEVPGCITVLPPHMHTSADNDPLSKPGTAGIVRTGMDICIRGDGGTRLGPNEQGEICVRGPAVLKGYFEDEDADSKAFLDGWFHTGDLGYIDEQGFVFLTGRASDMYISGGTNIYPREIEEMLVSHPAISEASVLGVPDPKWGESGVAIVVVAEGQNMTGNQLSKFLDGQIARYKIPKRYIFWEEIPKSAYGKVPKHLIRSEIFKRGDLIEGEPV